jgi:hypothetical protein
MAEAGFQPAGFMSPKVFGLPVDRKILFSNHKNIYKKRIEKRQRKLFVKLGPIKPFLRRNEHIMLVTTGYAPLNSMGQYLTGFAFSYLKRSLFVFTNQRIIHIPTTTSYKYKDSLAQMAYAGCQSISLKRGTLVVQYANSGQIEKFRAIAAQERKKIRALLKKSIPLSGTKAQLAGRIHICPQCARRLIENKYECSNCKLNFKSRLMAAFLAIVIPGGGYYYVRQFLLGALAAVLEIFLLVWSLLLLQDFSNQMPVNMIYLTAIPALYLYIKITAVIHSNHFIADFIPTKKNIVPGKKS